MGSESLSDRMWDGAAVLWDGCERVYLGVKCLYNQLELVREVVSHEGE